MSTKAMIAVHRDSTGRYELFYKHNDGNPMGLGQILIDCFEQGVHLKGIGELIARAGYLSTGENSKPWKRPNRGSLRNSQNGQIPAILGRSGLRRLDLLMI